MRLAALAIILAGCYPPPGSQDAQNEPGTTIAPPMALAVVLASYGAPVLAPEPRVRWMTVTQDCGGIGWRWGDGHCVRGVFQDGDPDVIGVATWPGAVIAQTAFAHECLHWLLFAQTGDANDGHAGNFYARVDAAEEALWRDE